MFIVSVGCLQGSRPSYLVSLNLDVSVGRLQGSRPVPSRRRAHIDIFTSLSRLKHVMMRLEARSAAARTHCELDKWAVILDVVLNERPDIGETGPVRRLELPALQHDGIDKVGGPVGGGHSESVDEAVPQQ